MVAERDLKLQTFMLTDKQMSLACDLHAMLAVRRIVFSSISSESNTDCLSIKPFKRIMKVFQSGTALIIDVLPAFLDIEIRLSNMSKDMSLAPICRVAAHAGLLQCQKYLILFDECEAVAFAVGM